MTTNRLYFLLLLLALPIIILMSGCSVGAKVAVTAREVEHPVSYTHSFYNSDDELVLSNDYEELTDFSFTFTKWGVSSWIEIQNSEDISNRLNKIIEKENGDAITNLKISINNPSGKNGLLWFSKVITISASALFTFLAITDDEHRPGFAGIAAGSTLAALFTPAAVDIKVEGTVVKIQ